MSVHARKTPPLWRAGDAIEPVAELLSAGGVLGIPTESSYGLAVDPTSAVGVAAIYELKRREARKPLPLVIADQQQALRLGLDIDSDAFQYGLRFWPAPLTMLVPVSTSVNAASTLALGELDEIAVRIPKYRPLLDLLLQLGHGLTATSANISGEPPLFDAPSVQQLLRDTPKSMVVDSEPLGEGAPSTVVAWREQAPAILRQGAFAIREGRSVQIEET